LFADVLVLPVLYVS